MKQIKHYEQFLNEAKYLDKERKVKVNAIISEIKQFMFEFELTLPDDKSSMLSYFSAVISQLDKDIAIEVMKHFGKEGKHQAKAIKSKVNEEKYYPYQIDDSRGKKLYDKYDKAMGDWNWANKVDLHKSDNYEQHIPLDKFLKKSGMTIKELKELENYTDESWGMFIDEDENMLKIYHD